MSIIVTILVLVFVFGLLVGIHEFGHFLAAKLQGIWVQEFALGFGPKLIDKKIGDTVYKLNLIPLGGYVKVFGESAIIPDKLVVDEVQKYNESELQRIQGLSDEYKLSDILDEDQLKVTINQLKEVSEEDKDRLWAFESISERRLKDSRRYSNKPIYQRLIVVCGGVIMNFLLGTLIYILYLILIGGRVIIPNLSDYNFIGSNTKNAYVALITVDKESEYVNFNNMLLTSVNSQEITDSRKLKTLLDENLDKEVTLNLFDMNKGKFEERNLTLSNEVVDSLFHNYFLIDKPFINEVIEGSSASDAELKSGDIIISVNGEDVYFDSLKEVLGKNKGNEVEVKLYREDGNFDSVSINLKNPETADGPILGTMHSRYLPLIIRNSYILDYGNPIVGGLSHAINMMGYQVTVMGKVIKLSIVEKDAGILGETVAGPIRVGAEVNNLVQSSNFMDIINLTALISLTLAIMNILPLPIVDGGYLVLLSLEKLRGRPLSERSQKIYNIVGLVFIVGLTLVVTMKDFIQVFIK